MKSNATDLAALVVCVCQSTSQQRADNLLLTSLTFVLTSVLMFICIEGFTIKRCVRRWYSAYGKEEKARI